LHANIDPCTKRLVQSSQHVFEGDHVFESYGVPEDIMLGAFNIFPKNYSLQHLPMFCTQHITNNKVNRRGMVLHQWVSNFCYGGPFYWPQNNWGPHRLVSVFWVIKTCHRL